MEAYAIIGALADPTRREIFERLADGPCSVGDLAAGFPVSRPAISQHLRVLKDAGLVSDTPRGSRRLYALEPHGLDALREYLETFWRRSLIAFKAATERTTPDPKEIP